MNKCSTISESGNVRVKRAKPWSIMAEITEATSIEELAVIISEALEAAGITATLSGGGAVSIYSQNQYMSHDLDFVTSADPKSLLRAIAPLGFAQGSTKRLYEHPRTTWLV